MKVKSKQTKKAVGPNNDHVNKNIEQVISNNVCGGNLLWNVKKIEYYENTLIEL
jgi:hypothetical protein